MSRPVDPFAKGWSPAQRWALLCAAAAGLASILLLAVAGWFLTAAAIAGAAGSFAALAFNYLIPSAAIRGARHHSHRVALRRAAAVAWRRAQRDGRPARPPVRQARRAGQPNCPRSFGGRCQCAVDRRYRGVGGPARTPPQPACEPARGGFRRRPHPVRWVEGGTGAGAAARDPAAHAQARGPVVDARTGGGGRGCPR